jgi:molybdopterin/thiamine biosynthesis adenylyltransferase
MLHQWYKTNIDLYHHELEIIKREIKGFIPFGYENSQNLSVVGRILIENKDEVILMTYPRNYPYAPPKVWLVEDIKNLKLIDFSEHYHQNYDKSLCLFTSDWGDGSWHFMMDTGIVVDKLKESIIRARKGEHSDDHFSIINPIPGKMRNDLEIYVPIEILNHILNNENICEKLELFKFSKNYQGRILKYPQICNVCEEIFREKSWSNFDLLDKFTTGCYVKLPFGETEFRKHLNDETNIFKFLKNFGLLEEEQTKLAFILLIFIDTKLNEYQLNDSKQEEQYFSSFYFLKEGDNSNIFKIPLAKVYPINLPNDIFKRTTLIFNENLENIRNKTVLVLGLGTLGSFVVLELVKTGVRNFILYDFDIFQTVNICRHIGDIKDIGRYKTDVVEEKIRLKNPELNVQKKTCNPFRDDDNFSFFIEDLANSDIIIDTTASYQVGLQLNKISLDRNKTVIYGWCGPNAASGRIFRVIPNETPCFYCVNLQLEKEPEKYPKIISKSTRYEQPQFAGYRQPGIPGISIDINFIGLFISRLCIQTLLHDNEKYSDALADHYIWQNRPEIDRFLEMGLVPQGEFRKKPKCPVCKSTTKKIYNPKKKRDIELILERGQRNLKLVKR